PHQERHPGSQETSRRNTPFVEQISRALPIPVYTGVGSSGIDAIAQALELEHDLTGKE
ncbi:hypothetical protein EVA_07271, partial [gut metagenome]